MARMGENVGESEEKVGGLGIGVLGGAGLDGVEGVGGVVTGAVRGRPRP